MRERMRGSPTQRGYGTPHRNARSALALTLPSLCGYGCGTWLTASSRWVAAHVVDGDPGAGWMVACALCNERAKGRYRAVATPGSDRLTL